MTMVVRRIEWAGQTASVVVDRIGDTVGCGYWAGGWSVVWVEQWAGGVDGLTAIGQLAGGEVVCLRRGGGGGHHLNDGGGRSTIFLDPRPPEQRVGKVGQLATRVLPVQCSLRRGK